MSALPLTLNSVDMITLASRVLAAMEVTPADSSDVTRILRSPEQTQSLYEGQVTAQSQPLTRYLIGAASSARVDHWAGILRRDLSAGSYALVLAGQDGYPDRLLGVYDAPPILFVRGHLVDQHAPSVAIIGSRRTAPETTTAAAELGERLAALGVEVVSGLALGVDAAAHVGALRAGRTTAVLGTGIRQVYPAQNAVLAESVAGVGALVSQFYPNSPPTPSSFLRRNATIAAMAQVVVVMDAAERSGSRQALTRATEYGRQCLLWKPSLRHEDWAHDFIRAGQARFFDELEEVLEVLNGDAA